MKDWADAQIDRKLNDLSRGLWHGEVEVPSCRGTEQPSPQTTQNTLMRWYQLGKGSQEHYAFWEAVISSMKEIFR